MVFVSHSQEEAVPLLKIFQSAGWKSFLTSAIEPAVALVEQGQAFLMGILDHEEHFISDKMKHAFRHHATSCIPIVGFVQRGHPVEMDLLKLIPQCEGILPPYDPKTIARRVANFISKWENQAHTLLRRTLYTINTGRGDADPLLRKLMEIPEVAGYAVCYLALFLAEHGDLHKAESLLLNWIRDKPNQLQPIYSLGVIYLENNHPAYALKLFEAAYELTNRSFHFLSDMAQAQIMLRQYDAALDTIERAKRFDISTVPWSQIQAKLLYCRGRKKEVAKLNLDPAFLKQLEDLFKTNE